MNSEKDKTIILPGGVTEIIAKLEERGFALSISGFLKSDTLAEAAGKMRLARSYAPSLPAASAPIPP